MTYDLWSFCLLLKPPKSLTVLQITDVQTFQAVMQNDEHIHISQLLTHVEEDYPNQTSKTQSGIWQPKKITLGHKFESQPWVSSLSAIL